MMSARRLPTCRRVVVVAGSLAAVVLAGVASGETPPAGETTSPASVVASGGATARPGVPDVLRGSVAEPPAVEPAAGPDAAEIAAGDRIWFVDRQARRLTGCRLISTSEVGVQRVQCTERRLPRGAVVRD